ncbi:MAG TPA: ABC transporter substrate-binding protein [Actinomycetota bacterium]|nr:ABC transporter substrate-binding protein [Actinomycetota bacterium]
MPFRKRPRLLHSGTAAVLATLAAACSGRPAGDAADLLIVVNAPFSKSPYIGRTISQGVRLAVDEINSRGGVQVAGRAYRFRVQMLDNALSPQKALQNVRTAVARGAVAIVDEGTGIEASWRVAHEARTPIGIVFQGGIGLVELRSRPNVFRIAPTDHGIAFRYAEYLIPKGLKVGFIHDDSDYGQQGAIAFREAFGRNPEAVAADIGVPADLGDPSPQVLEARRAGSTALLVWGTSSTIANVLRAARNSGWDVPVYTPPSGQDPLVRQQLSDHPEWIDGLTFASGRMTAERGPQPFLDFRAKYEEAFGVDRVGVETSSGEDVIQPPEYAMYPYDFVNVLAAAVRAAAGPDPVRLLDALNQVDVQGANGDERGFNEKNHEGVVDDDVYFALFDDMTFRPVRDDPLSSTLPVIEQTA